jgi:hypothetical protein
LALAHQAEFGGDNEVCVEDAADAVLLLLGLPIPGSAPRPRARGFARDRQGDEL